MTSDDPDQWSVAQEVPVGRIENALDCAASVADQWSGEPLSKISSNAHELQKIQSQVSLHGVDLGVCLSSWGRHFSRVSVSEKTYIHSYKAEKIGYFLSHDWKTSRAMKTLALLLIFNLNGVTICVLLTCISFALVAHWSLGALPMDPVARAEAHPSWFFPTQIALSVLLLCFWQRLRQLVWHPNVVFFDKLCIPQDDKELKAKGIRALGSFLRRSEHLIILWSPRYFSRLWCCYEVASFLRDSEKPVTFFPVAISELLVLIACVSLGVLEGTFLIVEFTGRIDLSSFVLGGCLIVLSPGACYMGVGLMAELGQLDPQLSNFNIRESECSCCSNHHISPETGEPMQCDRTFIYESIEEWYENPEGEDCLQRFDQQVRTTLRKSVLDRADDVRVPAGFTLKLTVILLGNEVAYNVRNALNMPSAWDSLLSLSNLALVVTLFWLLFWFYLRLCILGSTFTRWMSRGLATLLVSLLLDLSFAGLFWSMLSLPAILVTRFGPDVITLLRLWGFIWFMLAIVLYFGGHLWNLCRR